MARTWHVGVVYSLIWLSGYPLVASAQPAVSRTIKLDSTDRPLAASALSGLRSTGLLIREG